MPHSISLAAYFRQGDGTPERDVDIVEPQHSVVYVATVVARVTSCGIRDMTGFTGTTELHAVSTHQYFGPKFDI